MKGEGRSLGSVIGLWWLKIALANMCQWDEEGGEQLTRPSHNICPPNLASLLPQTQCLTLAFFLSMFKEDYNVGKAIVLEYPSVVSDPSFCSYIYYFYSSYCLCTITSHSPIVFYCPCLSHSTEMSYLLFLTLYVCHTVLWLISDVVTPWTPLFVCTFIISIPLIVYALLLHIHLLYFILCVYLTQLRCLTYYYLHYMYTLAHLRHCHPKCNLWGMLPIFYLLLNILPVELFTYR